MYSHLLKCATMFEYAAADDWPRNEEWWQRMNERMQERFEDPEYKERVQKQEDIEEEEEEEKDSDIEEDGHWMTAQYNSLCMLCQDPIRSGQKMFWVPEEGALHPTCCGQLKSKKKKELIRKKLASDEALKHPSENDIVDAAAVYWVEYGNPRIDFDVVEKLVAAIYNMTLEEAKDFIFTEDFPGGWLSDTLEKLYSFTFLPPPSGDIIRINHSLGLRTTTGAQRWALLDSVLSQGLIPQPEGSGKHSELPSAVFGLVDDPKAEFESRVYNRHFPFITADILKADLPPMDRHLRPGNVSVLNMIPSRYIIAVNGLPIDRFRQAVARWKPTLESNPSIGH
jgi:hypothetical protein